MDTDSVKRRKLNNGISLICTEANTTQYGLYIKIKHRGPCAVCSDSENSENSENGAAKRECSKDQTYYYSRALDNIRCAMCYITEIFNL